VPIPIQLGSLTTRLRQFLRIRGRVRLQLDETVVPTVQVQDLTVGPYLAGVQPAAGTLPSPGVVGGQVCLFFNVSGTAFEPILPELPFAGRSFTLTGLQIVRRTQGAIRIRIGTVPRTTLSASTFATIRLLRDVQEQTGFGTVPVVLATVAAIPFVVLAAAVEWFHEEMTLGLGDGETVMHVPMAPGNTIDQAVAIVIEETVAGALFDVNVRGVYQQQPS